MPSDQVPDENWDEDEDGSDEECADHVGDMGIGWWDVNGVGERAPWCVKWPCGDAGVRGAFGYVGRGRVPCAIPARDGTGLTIKHGTGQHVQKHSLPPHHWPVPLDCSSPLLWHRLTFAEWGTDLPSLQRS